MLPAGAAGFPALLDDFLSRVAQAPDAIAVQDGERWLTYRELAAHASGLAARLAAAGVGRDSVVAVYGDRSAELVVGELAALLAGAAYLPLDPAHPVARTRELLELSGADALVSALGARTGRPPSGEVFSREAFDVDLSGATGGELATPPRLHGAALAYVIYTSGSTGQPKGVAVSHASLASLMRWHQRSYRLGPQDRTTLLVSPGFDVSVWDTWPTLVAGGTLVVPPAAVRTSPRDLVAWLADERITVTFLPTPLAEAVLDEPWPAHTVLRLLHTGGSAMQRGVPDGLPFELVNVYGPAECTVSVTTAVVAPGGPVPPPIGVPNDGVRCYVLDGLDPVPDGEPGEMCLAGECVARGYLGDPVTTARSFVPDLKAPGRRMYRTGDLVRRRPDGVFEYLGRLDDQAKIRGFRVEPGEVAAVLRQHPAVRDAFVLAERSGHADARLVGYVASAARPADLIEFTAARLPGHMVPAAIVVLPALPMTPNGKVDRTALPAPDRTAAGLAERGESPRTPTEEALAGIVSRLLGNVEAGAADDFFALGGTSLMAGRLAAGIAAELAARVTIDEIFRARTVTAIAAIIDRRTAGTAGDAGARTGGPPAGGELPAVVAAPGRPPIHPARRDRPIPLSLPQERVWFFEQLSPGNLAYNFQATVSLCGEVDVAALRAALDEIVRRHEILRTAFVTIDGVGMQRPHAVARAPLRVLDIPAAHAEKVLAAEMREPFDLTTPPLARWLLLRHPGGENTFVHIEHHFVHDGWSLAVLLQELRVLYQAFAAGQPSPLPELTIQYADFTLWQRDWMRGEVLRAHVEHWTARLAGAPGILELPADRPRPPVMSFRGAAPRIEVPAGLSQALRSFSRQHRVSLFSTMYAGFAALLYRYTGQQDLLVGTGAANRSLPEFEPMLGMMVNTLVLRTKVCGQMPFTDLLGQVQQTVTDALAWSDTPVDAVIEAIKHTRDPSRTPLFQVMFSFHDSAVPDLDFGGLTGTLTVRANGSAKCDLNVIVIPRAEQRLGRAPRPEDNDLTMIWEYSTDLFDEGTMARMSTHYQNLLGDAVARPAAELGTLRMQTAAEAEQIGHWSRGPAPGYPADATIPGLFAAQAAANPAATALVFGASSVSYAELDRRSNALAWLLRRRGVGTDVPVGVAIERGPDLIAGLLAVLKAGGAYLPIDMGSPASRIGAMIAAAGARLVLSTAQMPPLPGVETIRIDQHPTAAGDEPGPPPDTAHPLSLAYISFTSGSTGVPKGVAVPQRAVIRLISDPTFASLGAGQRLLHLSPVAFDAATLEIWGALLTGGTVVIAPPGPLGLPEIASLLRTTGVTTAWLTAGLFHQLAEADINAVAGVPVVLAGGDVLNPGTVRAVLEARRGQPLVNGYGPTENTTFTTCHVMTDAAQVGATVPIGRPIQHTTVHILDEYGQPVPIGVAGELYAGGDGLARGYAGSAAATARAFVPDPSGHGRRLYRTGDLARWRADGTLEFAGRLDDQIKIRGFRVEPGEVEAVLRTHPGVRESVVVVAGQGAQRHLIGYVTPADGVDPATLRPSLLREFLAARLPDYLVPAGFKAVGRFPLNANGKVDKAALPAPDRESPRLASPPQGATEEQLADIWRRLLPAGDGAISREDNFFAQGGNSLLAARLMFRIREVFGVDVQMAAFYEAPTLAACATAIDAAAAGAGRPAGRGVTGAGRPATAPAGIGRRDRSAYRAVSPQTAPDRPIGRADRSAYRAAAPRPSALAPHLVPLAGSWALWRMVCLRSAGFPVHLLAGLGDTGLAAAADAVIAAQAAPAPAASGLSARDEAGAVYAAEFPAAIQRLSVALHEAASLPALREAVAWQNRHALTTGIDVLLRRGPEPGRRNTKSRQHEALVASYLQRYCAKNDTIGFFGPVSWSQIDDDPGIRITHPANGQSLASRITYLEGWAVRAVMAEHSSALRPWLVPRRMPFTGIDGMLLRLPLAPPVPLTPAERAVMQACDGIRDARDVAAVVLADPQAGLSDAADVFAVMGRLADSRRLVWQIDVAPQDIRPERSMRALLSRVTDDGVREPAEKSLDELTGAAGRLAAAAGDAERVAEAMAGLEATFTRLAGLPPTRRAGELYAGRTLAYEECLRGETVRLGADVLDGLRAPLALVLDSARWFIAACGARYARFFAEAYRQRAAALGTGVVPFADFWLIVSEQLFEPSQLIEPVLATLRQRWSAILDLPPGARRIQLRAADLKERVTSEFPAQPLPWPTAVHHSPDLMIAGADAAAGGRLTWVLGEVHPSLITFRYATWLGFHDAREAVRTAMRHDLRDAAVWAAETDEKSGTSTRLDTALPSPGDLRLVWAHDSCGYDPAETLTTGECDLISSAAGLRVRRRDGTFERGVLEVVGDVLSTVISNHFDPVPPAEHVPRITIDDLVVSREKWTLAATGPAFADTADESARYLQARTWAASLGLPRHVFLRFTGERKPIYADLTSLASIDLIARSLRRCRRTGADARVTISEMLPTPDQAWLTDAQGRRYTAELRVVAADQSVPSRKQEG
jgi:amino acid adenylation domain-containing protein